MGNNTENTLTQAEQSLLEDYRESNEQGKEAIEKTAQMAAENQALKARWVVA